MKTEGLGCLIPMNEAILTQIKSLKKLKMKKNSWPKKQKIFDRFEAAKLKTEITRKKAAGLKFIKKLFL